MLVGADGQLKLGDFGFARSYSSPRSMTKYVVTRAYRSPELLFNALYYGAGVDMWAVGCMFAELMLRHPLFPGISTLDQLAKIFNILGTPTEASWSHAKLLPTYAQFEPREPLQLKDIFGTSFGSEALDILEKMFTINPQHRISAAAALQHPFFSCNPKPTAVLELPQPTKKIP